MRNYHPQHPSHHHYHDQRIRYHHYSFWHHHLSSELQPHQVNATTITIAREQAHIWGTRAKSKEQIQKGAMRRGGVW